MLQILVALKSSFVSNNEIKATLMSPYPQYYYLNQEFLPIMITK